MSLPNKRARQIDEQDAEPSAVIHVRGLPEHTLELDLLKLFEHHGSVRDITMMPQKRQALVEFVDIEIAKKVVARSSEEPFRVGHHQIQVAFSTSKHILQRAGDKNAPPDEMSESMENHVLLYTVYNAQYPITIDLIHQISTPYGKILRIVMFRKAQVQAMVEFRSVTEARLAKRNLNGADIYTGCCTLKVDYARPTRLTVTKNDKDSWDFENTVPTTWENGAAGAVTASGSLLGRYEGNPYYHGDPSFSDTGYGYPQMPGQPIQNRSLMCPPQPYNNAIATSRSQTPVAMVYNMNTERMNCDRLFNLLCLYGNVLRVKFLRSNEGAAMVQMGDPIAVDDLIDNLSGTVILGKQILIRPSKQTELMEVSQPYDLPDGSPSFKDYSRCRNNRYSNAALASKNRKFRPSRALHYWNCPPNFDYSEMQNVFRVADAPIPTKMIPYTKTTGRTSSGVLQWDNEVDALAALAICNHTEVLNPEGGLPFILKFSFASAVIRDGDQNALTVSAPNGQMVAAVGGN